MTIRFILYANHHANQRKVRKTMPTIVPTTFNKWQNSAEKSQAHNLKVVGSNPTPQPKPEYINALQPSKSLDLRGFFAFGTVYASRKSCVRELTHDFLPRLQGPLRWVFFCLEESRSILWLSEINHG